MEFLLPFGITKETIAQVIKNNDETFIENLICDQEMVINNLNYFKEIGIKRINDLLIERTDLFLVPTEILKEKLDKFNLNVLSELVNEDFCNLELIDMY
ncbi:MAG: hypothetical protein MR227_01190 [Firmicutes bacterium]|nr:hypothetical protein [Bacillota bacterium]